MAATEGTDSNLPMRTYDILNEDHFLAIKPGRRLEAEVEEGNHEYKVKLTNLTDVQINHRISQLMWRLNEGNNEAVYHIGVEDDGTQLGLSEVDLKESLRNLQYMADQTTCEMIVRQLYAGEMGLTAEVVMKRKERSTIDATHLSVAVAGDADCGKSTLVGVLSHGSLDNGKGLARMQILRHNHEVETGRTSCLSHTVLHFNQEGEILNTQAKSGSMRRDKLRTLSDLELAAESSRTVSLLDLAGHVRYLKTTLHGISGFRPDYCFICVSALKGLQSMTAEHIGIGLYLQVPLVVVITKVDAIAHTPPSPISTTTSQTPQSSPSMTSSSPPVSPSSPSTSLPSQVQDIVSSLKRLFSGKEVVLVNSQEDIASLLSVRANLSLPSSPLSTQTIPIFCVSNVTGQGMDLLKTFLYQLPALDSVSKDNGTGEGEKGNMIRLLGSFGKGGEESAESGEGDFSTLLEHSPASEGKVLIGKVITGKLRVSDQLVLGPTNRGLFVPVLVSSIRLNNVPVRYVSKGQTATFRLSKLVTEGAAVDAEADAEEVGRKRVTASGLALLSSSEQSAVSPRGCWEFVANILVLNHPSKIRANYEPVVHIGSVKQAAKLMNIKKIGAAGTAGTEQGGRGEHKAGEEEGEETEGVELGNGERAECRFRFLYYPEYFAKGDAIIIREDRTRAVGSIIEIC